MDMQGNESKYADMEDATQKQNKTKQNKTKQNKNKNKPNQNKTIYWYGLHLIQESDVIL